VVRKDIGSISKTQTTPAFSKHGVEWLRPTAKVQFNLMHRQKATFIQTSLTQQTVDHFVSRAKRAMVWFILIKS